MTKIPLALVALLLLATAAFAEGWATVRTRNFVILGNTGEVELGDAARRLERFREALRRLFPPLKFETASSPTIILFKDQTSYGPFKPVTAEGITDDPVYGYFQTSDDVSYITAMADRAKPEEHNTLFHEYVHFVIRTNSDRETLPLWLNEGLAEYLENTVLPETGPGQIGTTSREHLGRLRRSPLIPIEEFLSADGRSIRARDSNWRLTFYSQAWAAVHYLVNGAGSGREERLGRLVAFLADRQKVEAELFEELKTSRSSLGPRLTEYLKKRAFRRDGIVVRSPQFDEAPMVTPVSDDHAAAYMGDLLVRQNRLGEAEIYLTRAAAGPAAPVFALTALGRLHIRNAKYADAEKVLARAAAAGDAGDLAHFYLAYAISRQYTDKDGMLTDIPPARADEMRIALKRSIEKKGDLAESYRLLAAVNLATQGDLKETIGALEKGLALLPGDENLENMLARALLESEQYREAQAVAEKLARRTSNARTRQDAENIIKVSQQYFAAVNAPSGDLKVSVARRRHLVVLRRSWVTEADVAAVDEDRVVTNLNRILQRPKTGERLVIGRIETVKCAGSEISYQVRTDSGIVRLTSKDFEGLRMSVLLEGSRSFQIGCDARLADQLTAMIVRPRPGSATADGGELLSITFMPDNFRSMNADDLVNHRTVVIWDDSGGREQAVSGPSPNGGDIDRNRRWRSISAGLRRPRDGEERVAGTIVRIDCSERGQVFNVLSGERELKLMPRTPESYEVSWFSIDAAQMPLSCGPVSQAANVLVTYKKPPRGSAEGELVAIEFIPEGFLPQD